jgi:hypothetical protein
MTEERRKYTVGSDNDNSSTTRTHAVDLQAQNLAQVWRDFKFPLPYSRVFDVGGTRVTVTVEEAGKVKE